MAEKVLFTTGENNFSWKEEFVAHGAFLTAVGRKVQFSAKKYTF